MNMPQEEAPVLSAQDETVTAVNAIDFLKSDHRRIEELFRQYEQASQQDRRDMIVRMICIELSTHASLEETIFYPFARDALSEEEEELIAQAHVEHGSIRTLIDKILQHNSDTLMYKARVKVLREYVMHHVNEEEERIFPRLERLQLDLTRLGTLLMVARQELEEGAD